MKRMFALLMITTMILTIMLPVAHADCPHESIVITSYTPLGSYYEAYSNSQHLYGCYYPHACTVCGMTFTNIKTPEGYSAHTPINCVDGGHVGDTMRHLIYATCSLCHDAYYYYIDCTGDPCKLPF